MAAGVVNLQSQVESVLGELVKAATVELTKLFESRYRASVEELGGHSKRSIGVQVNEDLHSLFGPLENGCGNECKEEEVEGLIPEILFTEINGYGDPGWLPLREQIAAGGMDMEFDILGGEPLLDSDDQKHILQLQVSEETSWCDPSESSPANEKPLTIKPDTSNATPEEEEEEFGCPLMIKSESPLPSYDSKSPIQSEASSTSFGSIKDSIYSPSSSDGAVLPVEGGGQEQIIIPEEQSKDSVLVKVKAKPSDQKLELSCSVVLVDVHVVSKLKTKTDHGVESGLKSSEQKCGSPLPKDLRRHQGVHTGHRLCCFTKCPNDIWRLQDIVAHSRDGYACSVCGKTFKHRKILRRHSRFHTGVKPYECSVCTKTFALRKSLRRHQRFHTGSRPHTCLQCGKSFRLRDNLKAHLRFHTGEKPYSCALCGKKFRIMRNLSQHRENPCHVFVPSFRTIAGMKQ